MNEPWYCFRTGLEEVQAIAARANEAIRTVSVGEENDEPRAESNTADHDSDAASASSIEDAQPGPLSTGSTGAITQSARPQGGYQVKPGYPATPRRLGIQGTTVLRVHVLIDGRVGDVLVQETAGHPDLDEAAAEAVRRWRFDPARRGNDPVDMWVLLPVEFRLK